MTTITKERIAQYIAKPLEHGLTRSESMEMSRMLLVGMNQQPIAWLNDAYLARGVVDGEAGSEDAGPGYIPAYREPVLQPLTDAERAELEQYRKVASQPAPVVPEWTNEQCLEFLSIAFRHAEIKGDLELDDIRMGVKMVNGSRAAMLQAGNSPVIKLPVEFYSEHGIVVQLERVMAALAVEGIRHERSGRVGNSPVIPDGWVKCSERMPEHSKAILVITAFGEHWTGYFDRTDVFWCDEVKVENVTHWMPLPAAPQQEHTSTASNIDKH